MSIAVITGAAGLIGSEAVQYFAGVGLDVIGIDNDMRRVFFGDEASTAWNVERIETKLGKKYRHVAVDIRDRHGIQTLFNKYGSAIKLVIHTAAQPSHDWAAREPFTDFDVNASGTLNLLEATRLSCPGAVFLFTSTNKVYGDTPNRLPFLEQETRWEIDSTHTYVDGIREDMSIDTCLHSLFGASKISADVMVQEYGRYFDMYTACFRCGTLTGPQHSATELHGFLGYVMRCIMTGTTYTVFGYKGKQVRDALHSSDLISAFHEFFKQPRSGQVYNLGGGRFSNCSVIEAIELGQKLAGCELRHTCVEQNRKGDHIWWIGSNARFKSHYPSWRQEYNIGAIMREIFEANQTRWKA